MPLIKIELARGKGKSFLLKLMDAVMTSVQETLKIPSDDTNIRLVEHDPEFFIMKKPYEILIEITLFSGRTAETRKMLFRSIVDSLHSKFAIDKDAVFTVLNEQPRENWGIRGGVPASEVGLGFKVDI
jgi:phenylpyruvate tautomerase PptA (4-oxalocrotonate tautomerase family)